MVNNREPKKPIFVDPSSGDSLSINNSQYSKELKQVMEKITTAQNYMNIDRFNECALEYVNEVFGDLANFKKLCPGWRVMGSDAGGVAIPRLISPKGEIYYGDEAVKKGHELVKARSKLFDSTSD